MTQTLHVLVDRRVLLDVGIRLCDIRLRLVVVVVRHEVLHRVVRQQLAQLIGQLRGQRLVRRHHQGGALLLLDQPRRRRRLARTRGTQQHHITLTIGQPLIQLRDRRRLVTCRLEFGDDLELIVGALNLAHRAVFGVGQDWLFSSESHIYRVRQKADRLHGRLSGAESGWLPGACRRLDR